MVGEDTLSHHSLDVRIGIIYRQSKVHLNYIAIYENALSDDECDLIIDQFEQEKQLHHKGCSGNGKVKSKTKKSTDITYNINSDCITSQIISDHLEDHVEKYVMQYPDINNYMKQWQCVSDYNIQRYFPGEGFYKPHCENCDKRSSYRVLVWMFYLNDVPDGGTLFPTLEVGIKAKKGRLVLWPSYWTHIHMGQISHTHMKYIATGWFGFI